MGERQGVDPASTGFFANVKGLSKQEVDELAELVHGLDDRDKQKLRDRMTFILTKTPLELREILRQNAGSILTACEDTLEAVRKHSDEMDKKLEEHTRVKLGLLEETIKAEKGYVANADTLTDEQVLASFVRQVIEHTFYAQDNFRNLPGLEEVEHPAATIAAFKRGIRKIIWSFQTPQPGLHNVDTEIIRRQGVGTKVLSLPKEIHKLNDELQKYLRSHEGARAVLAAEQEAREATSAKERIEREKTSLEEKLAQLAGTDVGKLKTEFDAYKATAQEAISQKGAENTRLAQEAADAVKKLEIAGTSYAEKQTALQTELTTAKRNYDSANRRIEQLTGIETALRKKINEFEEKKIPKLEGDLAAEKEARSTAEAANALFEEEIEQRKQQLEKIKKEKTEFEKTAAKEKATLEEKITELTRLNGEWSAAFDEVSRLRQDAERSLADSSSAFELSEIRAAKDLHDANKSIGRWKFGTLATSVAALCIAIGATYAVKSRKPQIIEKIVEKPVIQYVEKPVERPVQPDTIYWPVAFGAAYDIKNDAVKLLKETIKRMESEDGRQYSEKDIGEVLKRVSGNDKVITLTEVERANDNLGYTVLVDGKRFYIGRNEREKLNAVISIMEKEQGKTYNADEISRIVKATDKNNDRTITNDEIAVLKRLLGY
ncbi:MAG TPA: hypothetical protein VI612_04875 [Candidatus Nanoarchaeia archaeon]|nr:hypothetical protein [Candidatus Nanoarchaeia archaeon]